MMNLGFLSPHQATHHSTLNTNIDIEQDTNIAIESLIATRASEEIDYEKPVPRELLAQLCCAGSLGIIITVPRLSIGVAHRRTWEIATTESVIIRWVSNRSIHRQNSADESNDTLELGAAENHKDIF